ncbi:unnamed protein product (macronuclear) [Paramecium tetraurelia]|uniref:Protein kinase domain-containing protein n=1 Tax=Paramecium tetraurelia TaxID=5888 RepID=A0BXF2_PARTE|nr:uncharacterized protein GSPATT00033072001 [Paramecium tetraurelia]CAK63219.1 unnamed protein product [Paramecium tetraurelia]|eukprot:XP_001430617.1 hypothetical protein (macronuclear) [Paramecium tetraurelia strain d4-2]
MFPPIALDQIYVSERATIGIPFIKSYVDEQIPQGQRKEHALKQMIAILKQLNCYSDIAQLQNTDLQKIQDQLLQDFGYRQAEGSSHADTFQKNLGVTVIKNVHSQGYVCKVDVVRTPPFIYNVMEEQIAMKVYIQHDMYESREVEIIEQFNNSHQPYLYSYIRYSNLLILFLKQHKISFYDLMSHCIGPRKKFVYPKEKVYQGYLKIFHSMIVALEVLHNQGIVHRDLKPQNNMFDCQKQLNSLDDLLKEDITCVIIDYDRSKKVDSEGNQTNYVCNELYRPPEGTQMKYDSSYDIWQLGFIWLLQLHEEVFKTTEIQQIDDIARIFKLKKIFQDTVNLEDRRKNYDKFVDAALKIKTYVQIDEELHQIIKKMIHFNPKERPQLLEIKLLLEKLIIQNQNN